MKVDFFKNPQDLQCVVLANMGLHTNAIAERLDMSPGMAQYRILVGGSKGCRRRYRDGQSLEFHWAFQAIQWKVVQRARKLIQQKIDEAKKLDYRRKKRLLAA